MRIATRRLFLHLMLALAGVWGCGGKGWEALKSGKYFRNGIPSTSKLTALLNKYLLASVSTLLFALLLLPATGFAQEAWLETDEGAGRYDYISKADSTWIHWGTTWSDLSTATVWVDANGAGTNYPSIWQHDVGASKHVSTIQLLSSHHFPAANWVAGSALDYYLKLGGGNKATYIDELMIVDVQKQDISGCIINSPKQLVLQFSIDVGTNVGRKLNRLWVQNDGTLLESGVGNNDINYNQVKLYYETGTTFNFNGAESSVSLWGDYGGNSTSNNVWGNDDLIPGTGIPIPSDGATKLLCYVVIETFNASATIGRTAQFKIISDGISLDQFGVQNAFGLVRINEGKNANALRYGLPTVCPANSTVCVNDTPYNLTGATPTGGTYSGPGVTNNVFTPATAGVGTHTITYTKNLSQLVAYWNFNTGSISAPWNPPIASNATGIITAGNWTWGDIAYSAGYNGSTSNALFGDLADASLSLRHNSMNGKYFQIEFSMTGLNDLVVSYWTEKTSNGFNSNQWSWSTDGSSFTSFGSIVNPSTSGSIKTILGPSNINGAANVYLRYTLSGASGIDDNNRIDNLQLNASAATCTPCTFNITVNPAPTITTGTYGPVCSTAANIPLAGSPTGGVWSGTGVSGNQVTGYVFDPSVGTQILTYSVTGSNTCVSTATITITVYPLPTVTTGTYGPACINGALITLVGSPAGGVWSGTGVSGNQGSGYTFNPAVGSQTLTYTYSDGNGCSNFAQTNITVNTPPNATASSNSPVCTGGTINLSGLPSGTGITYAWLGPDGWIPTGASSVTEDFNGMSSSETATLPAAFKIGTDWSTGTTATNFAYGTTGAGVVTGTSAGGAINWANGITASATDRSLGFLASSGYTSPRSIIYAFTNTTGGTLTSVNLTWNYEKYRSGSRAFDWTFFHGNTSTADNAATSGNQSYPADANNNVISNPPTSVAKSVSITGISIPNLSTYYFRWTYTGNAGSTNAQGLGIDDLSLNYSAGNTQNPTRPNATVGMSGLYTLVVTDGNSCSNTATTTVTVNPTSVGGTVSSSATVCSGNNSGTLTLTGQTGSIVRWEYSTDGGSNWAPISNTAISQTYTNLTQTTLYMAVVQSGACSPANSTTATITMASALNAGLHNTDPIANCSGYNPPGLNINSPAPSGGIAPYTYNWKLNGTSLGAASLSTYNPPQLTIAGTYSYNCEVTDNCGTVASTTPKVITIIADPTVTISGELAVCKNVSSLLTANVSNGFGTLTYKWQSGPTIMGPWTDIPGETLATYSLPTAVAGTFYYQVIASASGAGCNDATAIVTVVVNLLPTAIITPGGPTTFCQGGSVVLTSSAASGNLWSTGETTQSINVATSGSYTVTVTDGHGCSAVSAATVVTVLLAPIPTIIHDNPTTFCEGLSVDLTSSEAPHYLWNTGAISQSFEAISSGSYAVTVTYDNGCSATSLPEIVTVLSAPLPTISSSGPTTFCQGESVVLTSSELSGNKWSTGATTRSITVSTSGSYTVKVTYPNACERTSVATVVTVNTKPTTSPIYHQ
jgi:hypothetical protein